MTGSTLNLYSMDSTTGQPKFAAKGDTFLSPPIVGLGGTPGVALTAAAGTGATVSIVGNNIAGQITVNSGTLSLASGKILTLTFADGFTFPTNSAVNFTAGNAAFAGILSTLYANGATTGGAVFANIALGIGTTYIGFYTISGW